MQISVPYTEGSPPQESVVPVSQQPKLQHKTITSQSRIKALMCSGSQQYRVSCRFLAPGVAAL